MLANAINIHAIRQARGKGPGGQLPPCHEQPTNAELNKFGKLFLIVE
jgi:hypothetical protein